MRHLFVTNDFAPKTGGIESYLRALVKGFEADSVAVVAPARIGYEEVDANLDYAVVRVGGGYMRGSQGDAAAIINAAKLHQADAIHYLQTFPLGRTLKRVKRATDAVTTVIVHGSEVFVPIRYPIVRGYLRRILRRADVVFCVSDYTRSQVEPLLGRTPVVLHPTVDTERFSPKVSGARIRGKLGWGVNEFGVLFVSRLVKRKGASVLIDAARQLPEDVRIAIVGTGPESKRISAQVESSNLGHRVTIAGGVSDAELPKWYAAADAFCLPCAPRHAGRDTEGFGIVFAEAAASGLPTVGGRCGGSAEAISDGEDGFVLDSPTADDVAAAILKLRNDPLLASRFGARGRARMIDQFTPKRMASIVERAVARARR